MLYKSKVLKNIESDTYCMPLISEETGEDTPVAEAEEAAEAEGVGEVEETVEAGAGVEPEETKEEIARKAYEEGFAAGEKAGFATGEQKAAILIESLEKVVADFSAFSETMVQDLERQVVDLASAIARKIISEEISLDPEIIVTMVKEALKRLQQTGTIMIKVNPAVYDLVIKHKPALAEIRENITIDVDPHLPVTGPLVIGETEEIVVDIESLLTNIMEKMNEAAQSGTEPGRTEAGQTETVRTNEDN